LLLLLQHEVDARRQLASFLAERGVRVETALTGTQAVNKAILIAPDAIVIDMAAPEGEDAAKRLKRSLVTRRIPILALADDEGTASPDWDAALPRSADPEALLLAVRRLHGARRSDH
jgi:CheY-like chemotaxis protein